MLERRLCPRRRVLKSGLIVRRRFLAPWPARVHIRLLGQMQPHASHIPTHFFHCTIAGLLRALCALGRLGAVFIRLWYHDRSSLIAFNISSPEIP
jgi:hypothetical protein